MHQGLMRAEIVAPGPVSRLRLAPPGGRRRREGEGLADRPRRPNKRIGRAFAAGSLEDATPWVETRIDPMMRAEWNV